MACILVIYGAKLDLVPSFYLEVCVLCVTVFSIFVKSSLITLDLSAIISVYLNIWLLDYFAFIVFK